jgi:hypothetical protein
LKSDINSMEDSAKKFSHVPNFTGYMEIIARYFGDQPKGLYILDLPAGNGLMADARVELPRFHGRLTA